MAKDAHEILPDEFNSETKKPKKDKKTKSKKIIEQRKSKLIFRMFSYVTTTAVTVSIVTGNNFFVEADIEKEASTNLIIETINNIEAIENKVDEVIEEIAQENKPEVVEEIIYTTTTCDECEGHGFICPGDPDFGYDRGNGYGFEGCHGEGYTPCPDIWCQGSYKICQSCGGSGDEKGFPCEVCDGDGIVDCEFCNNTGIAECITKDSHYTCLKCNGVGTIQVETKK